MSDAYGIDCQQLPKVKYHILYLLSHIFYLLSLISYLSAQLFTLYSLLFTLYSLLPLLFLPFHSFFIKYVAEKFAKRENFM